MRIEVTADHIRDGKRTDPCLCPVARAIDAANPQKWWAMTLVGGYGVVDFLGYVGGLQRSETRELPEAAREWIRRFDEKDPVEPFAFEMDVPES